MTDRSDVTPLRYALFLVGIVFVAGIWVLMQVWPSGWAWQPAQPEYEQMILGVYAVLGAFLLFAARDPLEHLSLIWFTVWSSLAHGGIMLWQALVDPAERGHLLGDVPSLILVALVLAWLTSRATAGSRKESGTGAGQPAAETP